MTLNPQKFILERNAVQFLFYMLLYSWVLTMLTLPITMYLDTLDPYVGFRDEYSALGFFLLAVVAAPLIETLLFQFIIIESFRKLVRNNKYVLIALSAGVFGASHLSSYSYAFANLIFGIAL